MKEFLLIFTIIQLIILITAVPNRCGNGVKYSYPGDNTKFIVCENHIPLAKKCPDGTTFNENVQVCDSNTRISNGDSSSRYVELVGGTSRTTTNTVEQRRPGENIRTVTYVKPSFNNQPPSNHLDQSLGTGHNNQPLNNLGQSNYHTPSYPNSNIPAAGQSTNHGYIQSGYSGTSLSSNNNLGHNNGLPFHQPTRLGQGLQMNGNSNQYGSAGQSGYHGVIPSQSTGTAPTSGYNNNGALSDGQVDVRQSYGAGNNRQYNTPNKKCNQCSDSGIGGTYNDHKNINFDNNGNDQWLQNQNHHGLDQSHLNLNEIRGSTGYSANSCNHASMGAHIAYSGDCTKFIVCTEDGKHVVKDCAPNTHFNPKLQICDWPNAAGCIY